MRLPEGPIADFITQATTLLATDVYASWAPTVSRQKHGIPRVGRTLRWVQDHADQYGGDPAKLFAVGQSAGRAHLASHWLAWYCSVHRCGTI